MHSNRFIKIVENYIKSYNSFDILGMTKDLHENIFFENISSGETNLKLTGIEAFKAQAEQVKNIFSERCLTITEIKVSENSVNVAIDYSATIAVNLSDSIKAGQQIKLQGTSVYEFENDKIITITDIS